MQDEARKQWCPVRGNDPRMEIMGGDPPVYCPSYCHGAEDVIIDRPMFKKFGPVVSHIGQVCVESSEPRIDLVRTIKANLQAIASTIKNTRT